MKVDLPALIEQLEEIIGLSAALKLVEAYGGLVCYVPSNVQPGHALVELLGLDAAAALSARFGRDAIVIPKCAALVRAKRDNQIRQLYQDGKSVSTLARTYALTERHVYRILASEDVELPELTGARADPRQRRLF